MDGPTAVALLNDLYAEVHARKRVVAEEEAYYRGQTRLRFATPEWRQYHAARYQDFSDNWCGVVANSPAERLGIDGFRLDEDPVLSDTERALWADWQANDMEAQASQGLLTSGISSRSYALVWGESLDDVGDTAARPDEPVVTWEHPAQVTIGYDPEHRRRKVGGLKTWTDGTTEFATLYTPAEVFKFSRGSVQGGRTTSGLILPAESSGSLAGAYGGWEPRVGPADSGWPLPNPMGEVPIVEFGNRPMLAGGPISEIRGTMAMQDAINLLWAYLFTAADFASMPARVVMGQEMPKIPVLDEAGQVVGEQDVELSQLAQDRILWLTGQNTSIGQWDAAKLDVFTGTIEIGVSHIAAQTRTPPHYLILGRGMVNVNADGMRAAEAGLVRKVGEQQVFYTPPTRDLFRLIALARGDVATARAARSGTVAWRDAENRSVAQLTDSLQKLRALGFPFEWIAEQYGLGPTEIARVLAMKEREAAADPVGVLA
ncbi:MAG: phage portal protein, partial [Acidimicrobiia bacterium]